MADDVLSAAEREALLSSRRTAPSGGPRRDLPDRTPPAPATILPYGRSPDGIEPDLQQALMAIHARCAGEFAAALSALARRTARVRAVSVRAASYRELDRRLENPTCLNLLAEARSGGSWLLEITLAVLYPAIDCMLGGGRDVTPVTRKPPTEIELRLAARLTSLFLGAITSAWSDVAELELSVDRVECNPRALPLLASDALAVCVRFDVELAGALGTLHLVLPAEALRNVSPGRRCEPADAAHPAAANSAPEVPAATVELVAHLAETAIDPQELEQLSVGDLLTTDTPADAPVAVLQNGVLRFLARSGAVAGRKALEIESLVEADPAPPPEDREGGSSGGH